MRTLQTMMRRVLALFALVFSERVWQHVQILLAGAILAPSKRRVKKIPASWPSSGTLDRSYTFDVASNSR